MSIMFRVLAVLLISLMGLGLMAGRASASVTLPHTQHWDTYSPWSKVYDGSSIDGSDSAPGSPSSSLKFTYPSGMRGGTAPDTVWVDIPSKPQEIWVQYWFKYSTNWTQHTTNDKQTYYFLGDGVGNGNFFVGIGKWGANQIFMEYQPASGNSGNREANTGYYPPLTHGVWYKLTIHAILNTPGVANGVIQLWINDGLVVNYSNVPYRESYQGGLGIGSMQFTPVWGGGSDQIKPATDYFWVDYTVISTGPIGSSSSPPPAGSGKTPAAPSSIIVQ